MSDRDVEATRRAKWRDRQERLALAAGLAERGEIALARREVQRLLSEDPQDAAALALLGRLSQHTPDPVQPGSTPSRPTSDEEAHAHETPAAPGAVAELPPTLPGTTVSTGSWAQFQRRMQLRRETTCMTAMRQAMEAGDFGMALDRARELVTIDPGWNEVALFLEQVTTQASTEASRRERRGPASVRPARPGRPDGAAMDSLAAVGNRAAAAATSAPAIAVRPGVAVGQAATVPRRRSRVPGVALAVLLILIAAGAVGWGIGRFVPGDIVWRWAGLLKDRLAPPAVPPASTQSPAQPSPLAEVPELPYAGIVPPPGGNLVEVPNDNAHPPVGNARAAQPPGTTHSPVLRAEPPATQPPQLSAAPATPEPVGPRSSTTQRADAARLDPATSANSGLDRPASTKTTVASEAPPAPGSNAGNGVASAPGAGSVSDPVSPPPPVPQTLPATVPALPAADPTSSAPSTAQSSVGTSDDRPSGTRATTGATPAPQAQPTMGVDTEAADREAIATTIGAYAQGYTSLNAAAVRRVWPTVNQDALRNAFDQLESQRVVFSGCMVAIRDLHATATCRGTATYVPKVGAQERMTGSHEWRFALRKLVNAWVIDSASIR